MSTQIEMTPVKGMPQELSDKGWGLFLTDNMRFRARNEERDLDAGPCPTADDVIAEARDRQVELDEADAIRTDAAEEEAARVAEANRVIEEAKQSPGAARTEALTLPLDEPPPRMNFEPYTTLLAVHTIDPEVALSMRADGLNMLKVAEYAEAMLGGAQFPAADVFFDGKVYRLAGGAHRHQSTIVAKLAEFFATVHPGTRRDALIWAASENRTHGLARSNDDKRLAVEACLRDEEWVAEADSVIAAHTGTSQPFVGKVRETLETQNIISPQPKRRGKDRIVRDTSNIGAREETETADVDDRQTSLADIGVELPAREEESALTTATDPGEIAGALERHGGVLMRMQLEEMGFKYGDILDAVTAGAILQPETGKFTLPDHKPQPSGQETGDRRQETGESRPQASSPAPPRPKQKIEELLKGRMLTVSFTWIPKVAGVSVSVKAGKPEDAERGVIASAEVPPLPEVVVGMIARQLKGEKATAGKAGPAPRRVKVTKKKPAPRKAASRPVAKKAAKKKSTKKAAKRRKR